MVMTMAFPKLFVGDLKAFSLRCDPCCCVPNWESTQLNPRLFIFAPRLAIAGHFAYQRRGCDRAIGSSCVCGRGQMSLREMRNLIRTELDDSALQLEEPVWGEDVEVLKR
jgi:hypothetical protein